MLKRLYLKLLFCVLFGISGPIGAGVISTGTTTTTVPADLDDAIGNLTSPLPAGQFLLPIQITGANGLQDWGFDLGFDDSVVTPLDVGGLFQSVYAAHFNAVNTTLSGITSSGFPGLDVLAGIAGFSSGASGDGLLAFVLFEFLPGQSTNNPGFSIQNPSVTEAVP